VAAGPAAGDLGLRSSTLQVVATATVAAYSSGEGLGRLLITGNATRDYPQMFAGAFMVAVLAVVLDICWAGSDGWPAAMQARPSHERSRRASPRGETIDSQRNPHLT
jgi:osmoprotectant transport system permease protein